jgi:hypothetical protein
MSADDNLDAAARAMIAAVEAGRSVAAALKKSCPCVYRQIVRDRRRPELLSLWGCSVNVDENVGATIVHPAIIAALSALARVVMRGDFVHAGVQHTYGYLFSLIETPYGRKRQRWVTADLERGFGIERSLLGDEPRQGTLLANLTWFLGKIVYAGVSRYERILDRNRRAVARELVDYDYAGLARWRIEERPVVATMPRAHLLRTDVVQYPHPPADPGAETALLIYSVQRGERSAPKLITAFPIRGAALAELRQSASAKRAAIRPRYNAYVPGWPPGVVMGRRTLIDY